jgi:segregation and condensation protein B
MERGLVKIAGRAEIPGRPLLYETTQFFLDHFGLRTLDELPNVEELRKRYLPVNARSQPAAAGTANGRQQSKESASQSVASDQTAPAPTSRVGAANSE